jgi:hypothetical protein
MERRALRRQHAGADSIGQRSHPIIEEVLQGRF